MLLFYYGVMWAGKSLELIRQQGILQSKNKDFLVFNWKGDTRFWDSWQVSTRLNISIPAHTFDSETNFIKAITELEKEKLLNKELNTVFIDEVQFLTPEQVESLYVLSETYNMNVCCFGLTTNFKGELFPASKRLLEISDKIINIPAVCWCGKPATMNARLVEDETDILIGDSNYTCLCYKHFKEHLSEEKNKENHFLQSYN